MRLVHVLLGAIASSLVLAQSAAADQQKYQLSDLKRTLSLSDPQISPDGKRIAVIQSTPDWDSDKSRQEIDLVDVATGNSRPLTYKREGVSSPRWSPDGSRLAFIAQDPGEHRGQIFVMRMDGGDPVRVTDAAHDVDAFSWSPDGKQFAFVTEDEPANAKDIKAHDDAFEVDHNNFLARAALAPWHLWVVGSDGSGAKRLTQGAFSLQNDQQDSSSDPVWSHDGKSIAFTRYPDAWWGVAFHSTIASVSAHGGAPDTLVPAEGSEGLRYAPHGDGFAYGRSRNGDQNNGVAVYVVANGKTFDATKALARNINDYRWLPDGALLLAGELGAHEVLWREPLNGTAKTIDLGNVEVRPDFSVSNTGAVAFIGSTSSHPGELYVLDTASGKAKRLTNINGFFDRLALGRTEAVDWQGPNNFAEDGVLTYPPDYDKGRKYPLVLVVHGGPEGASTFAFAPLPQLLAASGFLVFQPNYRGSTNLGDAYQHAIFRDTGEGPGKDVMAGLDVLKKRGIVDASRIGVSGWSYGGYMTTWLSGHYPVWKAAVAGAALTDWVMDYTVSFYQQGDVYFFGGSPWSAKYHDIWRQQSPIASADKVTAPTLIMGDVGDPNVPLVNSYEWYHALRDNGVEVKFFAYPVDTHFPRDLVRTTDVYRRWVGWMTQHLK